ncbi:MAG: SRPBCC family protein [Acidimicrobiales bacterium]
MKRLYGPVVARDTIDAPPADVYQVISDPNTYPDWLVGNTDVRKVDSEFPAPGASFDHSVGIAGPVSIDDSTEAVGAERNQRVSLIVHVSLFHARVDLELAPRADGGTDISFAERPSGFFGYLTPALRPLLHGRNRESLRRLRDRIADAAAA